MGNFAPRILDVSGDSQILLSIPRPWIKITAGLSASPLIRVVSSFIGLVITKANEFIKDFLFTISFPK